MFKRFLGSQDPVGVGGVPYTELVARFGTPLYVFDVADARQKMCRFKRSAAGAKVSFASKANSLVAILAIAREEGLDVDVASEGELEAALRAGFAPSQITVHGNNKSDAEMKRATAVGVGHVVIDHFSEIERLDRLAERGTDVLVRVAPGVDPDTHEAISTGQEDTKFGFSLRSGAALEAIRRVERSENLSFRGLHCHVGSQLMDSTAHLFAIERVAEFCKANFLRPEHFCIGGGLGVRYLQSDEPQGIDAHVSQVLDVVSSSFEDVPSIGFEPGRCLVAEAGVTLYTVGVRKETANRTYLSVDGGLADNPRPQLYGATYTAFNATRVHEAHTTAFRISGRHCETDTLIGEARLPEGTTEGDLIAVQCTGAYSHAMASNYNRYPRPPVVLVEGGRVSIGARRETLDDLFATEALEMLHR